MPFIPCGHENSVNIEPQYDGVLMFSPDVVFFNDAQPRPDGRKIYHIFEHSLDDSLVNGELDLHVSEKVQRDFDSRRNELFSKASEHSIQNIQQVLAKNGISIQECCPFAPATLESQVLQPNGSLWKQDSCLTGSSAASHHSVLNVDNQEIFGTLMHQRLNNSSIVRDEIDFMLEFFNFKLYKVYQFYINFPPGLQSTSSKMRLLKRLQKRGVSDIHFEPENYRITLKTIRSAQFILKILKKIDQNVFLISTTYDLVLNDSQNDDDLYEQQNLRDL